MPRHSAARCAPHLLLLLTTCRPLPLVLHSCPREVFPFDCRLARHSHPQHHQSEGQTEALASRSVLQIVKAVEDGHDVRGITMWTLIDNFEWACESEHIPRMACACLPACVPMWTLIGNLAWTCECYVSFPRMLLLMNLQQVFLLSAELALSHDKLIMICLLLHSHATFVRMTLPQTSCCAVCSWLGQEVRAVWLGSQGP